MEHTRLPVWRVPRAIAALIALALVATSVLVAQAPANAAGLGVSVARVPATAPPSAHTDPPGGVWLGQFITYAIVVTCGPGADCPGVEVTVPNTTATPFVSVSAPNYTNTSSLTTVMLGDILASTAQEFVIIYDVRNAAGPTFQAGNPSFEPSISLSGVEATDSGGGIATQVGAIVTPSFQMIPTTTRVLSADNAFSGKRSQTVTGTGGNTAGPSTFDYLASVYVVDVPIGARITSSGSSPVQAACEAWNLPVLPSGVVERAYLICVAAPAAPYLIMEFDDPAFADGSSAPINTRAYIVETGADPAWRTLFVPGVATQVATSGITQIIDNNLSDSSVMVGPFASDLRSIPALDVSYGTTPTATLRNSTIFAAPYVADIAAAQDTLTVTSGGAPLFYEHHVLQNLSVRAVLADYTNVYAQVSVTQSNGDVTVQDVALTNINPVSLIFSDATNPLSSGGNFTLTSNSPITDYEVVIRRLTGPGGGVVPFGLSIGSSYRVTAGYHTSYLSVVSSAQAPGSSLQHCQTWDLQPADLNEIVCAGTTVTDAYPLGPILTTGGTIAEGATTNVAIGFTNGEAVRTINDATLTVVLPPGFSYTGAAIVATQPTGVGKSPSLGNLTVTTITPVAGGYTRLTFDLPTLVPVTPWISYVPTGGFTSKSYNWNLPVAVASDAYSPPASDTSRITLAITADSLGPWGNRYVTDVANPPTELGLGAAALPWTQNTFRVTAVGQIRATSAVRGASDPAFSAATTVVAGESAMLRRTVVNGFNGTVTSLRLYDNLPQLGDIEGSEFSLRLSGPPTFGTPSGWTTLVSNSANPCRTPSDADPAGCSGSYGLAGPSTDWPTIRSLRFDLAAPLLTAGTSEISYPVVTPVSGAVGASAFSRFAMFGLTSNAAAFSDVRSGVATISLLAPAAAPPATSPAGMALTGLQPFVPAVGAFFALLLGSVMLLIVRRSRRPR